MKNFRCYQNIVKNIVRKEDTACYKQISPFLTMFSTLYGTYSSLKMHFKMSSAICLTMSQSKFLSLRAISPFPTEFSTDLFCRHVKTSVWEKG